MTQRLSSRGSSPHEQLTPHAKCDETPFSMQDQCGVSTAPNPDTAVGATLIIGNLLSDLEKRLTVAEESTFGPRPCDPNKKTEPVRGLITAGRSNVERLSGIGGRLHELLSAIGV